ncbi:MULTISPECIES: HAD family hydrolase [unclassified Modestobacter]|uniref:HAD family hydrolase n=1 Tax=unclassified Modestobacter TaxID=2643866 RepID=UPI0022AB44D7|nr:MULTISPECIES: HAD family hydrolase [unclassified Modestobacter]MCZ2813299.1 HAD family hydrolase [Modestobacter sp. VKM Ac-2979]MCZ2842509.1 HAD family hydrolase [Modestobacter sp. VKM Ac-2980]MCZ2846457.1 HAD family hydrolase [Modestobacter sp. VKM Ac-2978]
MTGDQPGGGGLTAPAAAGRAQELVDLGDLGARLGSWRPRLVVSDMDGTLLDSDGEVSGRTAAAVAACRAAGIPVVGATGRGPRLLESVRAALGGQGIAVLAQGGYVVRFGSDGAADEVLRTVGMTREVATEVIAAIEDVAGELIVAVEDAAEQAEALRPLRVQHGFDWPYPEPAHLLPRHEVLPVGAVLKVFLRSPRLAEDQLVALARSVVDPADAELTHAGLGFIEVLPPGVTKATGLAVALAELGIGFGDVLVFGDMPNDLPMFQAVTAAGGRAVAMANAHLTVRAAAGDRTSGHDADGVARYLEALLALEGTDV